MHLAQEHLAYRQEQRGIEQPTFQLMATAVSLFWLHLQQVYVVKNISMSMRPTCEMHLKPRQLDAHSLRNPEMYLQTCCCGVRVGSLHLNT